MVDRIVDGVADAVDTVVDLGVCVLGVSLVCVVVDDAPVLDAVDAAASEPVDGVVGVVDVDVFHLEVVDVDAASDISVVVDDVQDVDVYLVVDVEFVVVVD